MSKNEEHEAVAVPVADAHEVRKQFFSKAKKVRREKYTYNDVMLEFVQPTVGAMVNKSDADSEKAFFIRAMIEHSVVPGTDEKVFDISDYESLLELPADGDFQAFTKIVTSVMNLDVGDRVKN